jgi:tetratricopeptide (TPR) repeat protein
MKRAARAAGDAVRPLSREEGCASMMQQAALAGRRRDWPEALRRWDEALAGRDGAAEPAWRAARAEALFEAGRTDAAEAAFREILLSAPGFVRAEIGLARVAMRQWRWPEALACWDRLLQHAGGGAPREWHLERALTLRRLARFAEAEAVLRPLLEADPGFAAARTRLVETLTAAGAFAAALREVSNGDDTRLAARRIELSIRRQRLAEATAEFRRATRGLRQPSDLDHLIPLVPRLFEGRQRTQAWLALQRRLHKTADGDPGAAATALRLRLALKDYRGFLREIDRLGEDQISGEPRTLLLAAARRLREPGFPDRRRPKAFGIGLSRTGTTPLALALRILGLVALHAINPLTGELVSDTEFDLFDAATDNPVAAGFERLYHRYPSAKFIYTTRPLDHWLPSLCEYLQRRWGMSDFATLGALLKRPTGFHFGRQWAAMQSSLYFGHADYAAAYRFHDRRVRDFFHDKPKERWLEVDVFSGDGWAKLCPFLEMPIPSQAFPQPLA